MKNLLVFVILVSLCGALAAQQLPDKPAISPPSADLTALQTAYSLAKYGYSAYSASALIGAAEILSRVQTQPLDVRPEMGTAAAASGAASKPEFTPANLLADAKDPRRNNMT